MSHSDVFVYPFILFCVQDGKIVNWVEIPKNNAILGHIATYYSDQKANLPVRGIRKKWDSKADPNIETKTYGLFTTCMPSARKNIVENNESYIFFFTHWKGQRLFTGYYELGSYVITGLKPRAKGKPRNYPDYALLAKRMHFVRNGIPLTGKLWSGIKLENFKGDHIDGYGPRNYTKIDEQTTLALKEMLDKQEDASNEYIEEMHKLEEENLKKYNYRYPSWQRKQGFRELDFGGFIK